jgi:hypothetical protein
VLLPIGKGAENLLTTFKVWVSISLPPDQLKQANISLYNEEASRVHNCVTFKQSRAETARKIADTSQQQLPPKTFESRTFELPA